MKILYSLLLLIAVNCIFTVNLDAQKAFTFKSRNVVDLKPNKIRGLTLVQLEKGKKKFPDSYLLGLRDDKLILATEISSLMNEALFVKSEISLFKYDYLTILDPKVQRRKSLIWGTLLGAGSYWWINQNLRSKPLEARQRVFLGQRADSDFIVSLIGGITGAALGSVIGRHLAKRKINLRSEKRILRQLREVSFY